MKYKFIDQFGHEQSIEIDDDLCITLQDEDRKISNLERKVRDHVCMSIEFDGAVVADNTYEPSRLFDIKEQEEWVESFLSTLTTKQASRVRLAMSGYSYREIARLEGVDISTVTESFKSVRKKYNKFKELHPLN